MTADYRRKRIYLSPPHMGGSEQKYINAAFTENWIAPVGPDIDAFEQELAQYAGTKGAVAMSSGTAALHIALRLIGIKRNDTVFCSDLTFVGSANPILYEKAIPVFIDSEPDTWNMSPIALTRALESMKRQNNLPKAIIIVNIYGQSAKMDELAKLCNDYGVPIIEDAAESLGATFNGKKSGSFGRFGIFSFNGNKIITTSGGGMLVSNDLEKLKDAKSLITQARDPAPHYEHSTIGYNYRLSNILAGIGRGQLEVLDDRVDKKRMIFRHYQESLQNIEAIRFMPEIKNGRSTRWLTTFTIDPKLSRVEPIEIIKALEKEDIEARPVWKPMHLQPLFRDCAYFTETNEKSLTESLFQYGLCLPSGSNLTESEQNKVIQILKDCFNG